MMTSGLVVALLLLGQYPVPGLAGGGTGEAIVQNPGVTFDLPCSQDKCVLSTLTNTLGGTLTRGSGTITGATLFCQKGVVTTVDNVSVAGAGASSWTYLNTFTSGTTFCTVTVTDSNARTAKVTKQFDVTNPDNEDPVVTILYDGGGGVGGNFSTTAASVDLQPVRCTDDPGCTSVRWDSDQGVGGLCTLLSGAVPTTITDNCAVQLEAPNNLTTVNTVTVKGFDQAGRFGTDQVVITRTVNLEVTTEQLGSCLSGFACTKGPLTARGGTVGTYTFDNNGGGTSLNDGDADCANLTLASNGTISGTHTGTGTCSFTARVNDGVTTSAPKALSINIIEQGTSYFATLAALTDGGGNHYAQSWTQCSSSGDAYGCSLSNGTQLKNVSNTGNPADYSIDSTTFTMPVFKLTWPVETVSIGGDGIRMPIYRAENGDTDTYLYVWDVYLGPSWRPSNCGGNVPVSYTHKEFQLSISNIPGATTGPGYRYIEMRTRFDKDAPCTDVGTQDVRYYGRAQAATAAEGATLLHYLGVDQVSAGSVPDAGQGTVPYNTQPLHHSMWTRYWIEIRMNQPHTAFTTWVNKYGSIPAGTYHMVSVWVADEGHDAVRQVFQAPFGHTVGQREVTSATCSGNTATVETATATGLSTGELVEVYGAPETDYNGIFTVASAPSATSITYTIASCPGPGTTTNMMLGPGNQRLAKLWYEHNTSANHPNAEGFVIVTGTGQDGTAVPKNAQWARADGETFILMAPAGCQGTECAQACFLTNGSCLARIQAVGSTSGGPVGNTDAGVQLNFHSVKSYPVLAAGIDPVVTVAPGGLTGGRWLLDGNLISYERWFHVLKNYTLNLSGSTSAEDVTNNPVIFQRPQ